MARIILYVDNLFDDNIGEVTTPSTIAYNNEIMLEAGILDDFKEMLAQNNQAQIVVAAGRYICFTSVSLEDHWFKMFFINPNRDEALLAKLTNKLDTDYAKRLVWQEFNEIKNNYSKMVNKVKLVKGTPPL